LSEALREEGFKTCANDPCLLFKDNVMVVLYVDNLGIAYCNKSNLNKLFSNLKSKGLTLTQKGLIQKINEAIGMSNSNYKWTPATQAALGIHPDGPPMEETWSYRSMVLYLSIPTLARTSASPSVKAPDSATNKRSVSVSAVKTLVHLLHRTCDMVMIVKPTGNVDFDCYVDADFAGLHGRDPDCSPTSAES
jgi:hypothetical protein